MTCKVKFWLQHKIGPNQVPDFDKTKPQLPSSSAFPKLFNGMFLPKCVNKGAKITFSRIPGKKKTLASKEMYMMHLKYKSGKYI